MKTVFIDTSFYLSLLYPSDSNHREAVKLAKKFQEYQPITSAAVLGELLTVGSMRFNKKETQSFVDIILEEGTLLIYETPESFKKTLALFKKLKSKNISWVDTLSKITIEQEKIDDYLSFDKDFKKTS